ncbi:hypothetical protein NHX12_026367 [Muraenolepis orangiensis]|uniref:Uncharacterized protein n=1 Tax=Muraenolepis orangiensis TaxID=630683 RepID=A0A9Q0EIH0_9TELE|nr:hypothetical protein NHX12_026367 [Muraenolepis orangiensis]
MLPGSELYRFYTVDGCSLSLCQDFKVRLEAIGQNEVKSSDQCDYLLAFCPIRTRPGIDIQETMAKCPDGKPVLLVVLHHTYDGKKVVCTNARLMTSANLMLSVDCMFYEERMLKCDHNEREFNKIEKVVGRPRSKLWNVKRALKHSCYCLVKHKMRILLLTSPLLVFFMLSKLTSRTTLLDLLSLKASSLWNYLPCFGTPFH